IKILKFQKFFKTLSIINVDKEIMETFSDLRRYLRRKGNLIDNFDLVIAATCLTYNLVLITGNLSHFERIPKLKIYAE
ncbi:type II toxin-antitoxin system VapC family toxin, partial [Patescibacteria group bacterium]|nr:type II toxin-antitoxin system VapC family toxin [Patescibacteria group bacterium]